MASTVRRALRVVVLLLLALWTPAQVGAETPIPPAPTEWVTDTAGLLSPQTVNDENARLRAYERSTGHQILVYVAPTTGGVPIEDWANAAFERWKVGRKNLDDGLVLFIFAQDRTLRFEVGYGLESRVPDVLASRIIRETIAPALKAGQPDRGVTDGIERILQLTGDAAAANAPAASGDDDSGSAPGIGTFQLIFYLLVLVVIGLIAIRSPWFAFYLLMNIFGGRGGGYSGGGGGFSGGGGRSGGGGASGSW